MAYVCNDIQKSLPSSIVIEGGREMNMRRKGSKGKWPAKFRRGLSLALCASMAGPGFGAHGALADTAAGVLGDEL